MFFLISKVFQLLKIYIMDLVEIVGNCFKATEIEGSQHDDQHQNLVKEKLLPEDEQLVFSLLVNRDPS
jgi:hypothetical protein